MGNTASITSNSVSFNNNLVSPENTENKKEEKSSISDIVSSVTEQGIPANANPSEVIAKIKQTYNINQAEATKVYEQSQKKLALRSAENVQGLYNTSSMGALSALSSYNLTMISTKKA